MSRTRVADLPRDRQAQLVLKRALAHIEARRTALAGAAHLVGAPTFYQGWPLSLPNPRWVVELVVEQTSRRARSFRLDGDEQRELTDALLVALALEAAP